MNEHILMVIKEKISCDGDIGRQYDKEDILHREVMECLFMLTLEVETCHEEIKEQDSHIDELNAQYRNSN